VADIVIVEDEEAVRVLSESILQAHGHTTLSAGTVDQAVALLGSDQNIDLLFTEIGLQGDVQGGLLLAQEAVKRRPDLCVLYTSAQGVTDGMKALFVEKSAFLPKPYTVDQLVTTLLVHFSYKAKV
jgi:two-component system, cell cycle sensor histidine kinase and response regulator CckA